MKRGVWTGLCVAVGATVLVGGCATAPDEQPTPRERANRAAERQVDRALERGYNASEDLSSYTVRIRYNPPRCDGPAFEAYLYGRWTRVYLEAGREQREQIDAFEEESSAIGTRTVEGVPTGWRRAETDVRYRTFYVESFEP